MPDLVTTAEALTYLGWSEDQDGFLAQTVPQVSEAVRAWCPLLRFDPAVEATERYDGGAENLVLRRIPVTAIAEVKDLDDDSVLDGLTDYDFVPESGLLYLRTGTQASVIAGESGVPQSSPYRWGPGRRRWSVKYSAGQATVPADVALCTLEVVAMLAARRDQSASAVSLGDLSTTHEVGESGMPKSTEAKLARYHAAGLLG